VDFEKLKNYFGPSINLNKFQIDRFFLSMIIRPEIFKKLKKFFNQVSMIIRPGFLKN
jgi:hypothetical protein